MNTVTAHIINHTHWDREWFLTSETTNRWIGGLIDKIKQLAQENPGFQYFLDGQTLVIEDLLENEPGYRERVEHLAREGNLLIGPYYCQPDWRLAGGETLLRNLLYGRQDMQRHGAWAEVGWLVDTFGHISQTPQLHRLFGLEAVYIWRGAPTMEPYFQWESPDGSRLFTTNLFGGYRNLYGVTRTPEIAVARLLAELDKLRPYYPTPDTPLFDGYDLENDPEDPIQFYQERRDKLPEGVHLKAATPGGFAAEMKAKLEGLPVLVGELNSGKFGAVFPGSLSSRTYLKVMASDCESLLYRVCEPLAALAAYAGRPHDDQRYDAWSRTLLRNAVHDCICGVSIDQVHEKMEYSYRQAFDEMVADLSESLAYLMDGYPPGIYCVSSNPFHYQGWQASGERLYPLLAEGVGVWPAGAAIPVRRPDRQAGSFSWQNGHYQAQVLADGRVRLGKGVLGTLLVYQEHGDTYSEEVGPLLGTLESEGHVMVEEESEEHAVLSFPCSLSWQGGWVSALVRLTFDRSPLLRWQVELEGRGVNYRVEMVFETGLTGQFYAGMPFDRVSRTAADLDLLPRDLDGELASILTGQRELGEVSSFPFHEYVVISDGSATRAVFAKGLHAYRAGEDGNVSVPLLRAVEWLAKPDLPGRSGDAGPSFYVPDARCERRVTHELAFACLEGGLEVVELEALNAGYQNPPLLVEVVAPEEGEGTGVQSEERRGASGKEFPGGGFPSSAWELGDIDAPTAIPIMAEEIPMSSLHVREGKVLVRLFNPGERPLALSRPYPELDVFGNPLGLASSVPPKRIITLELPRPQAASHRVVPEPVKVWNLPDWRVGVNHGSPDPVVMERLRESIERLEREAAEAEASARLVQPPKAYQHLHRAYVLHRELLEYRLSLRLNEIKLGTGGRLTYEYLYEPDEQVEEIGYELNQMRIQRRIFDYVVQLMRGSK